MPDTLDLFAWNPHRGNSWRRIRRTLNQQIRSGRPDVIVLNEVRRHHGELAAWCARKGYDHFQEMPRDPNQSPVPEQGSTALLVTKRRVDLGVLSHRVIPMRVPWRVFSHNMPHQPRRYERVRLQTDDGVWKVTASHWPTNGFKGGNRIPFAESATRAAGAFRFTRRGTSVLDVGDHNENVRTLSKWARVFGGTVVGHGPDSLIATGATVSVRKLPKWGSDHHALRYQVTRR